MNKITGISFALFIFFSVTLFAQKKAKSAPKKEAYNIKVKVNGLKDTTCFLAYYYGDKQYLKDTAKGDANGLFVFSGTEPLPGGMYIFVLPGNRYFDFFVTEQNFSLETDTSDYVKHMKVKGSSENQLFYDFLKFIEPKGKSVDSLRKSLAKAKTRQDTTVINEKISAIDKEVQEYRKNIIKNNPGSFIAHFFKATTEIEVPEPPKDSNGKIDSLFRYKYYKAHFFDHIDFTDDRILRTSIYHQKIKQYFENVTVRHPDSLIKSADFMVEKARGHKELFKYTVYFITNFHETSKWMGADAIFVHMVEKYYMTKQAFWVDSARLSKISERAMLMKPLLIGKIAPNIYLADTLGKLHPLHNLKAKYTIAYFWDPDCGHCQKETPKLYNLYKKYRSSGVEVYAANIDREPASWKKYIKEHKLDWLNVYDPNMYVNFTTTYDVYSTPVIYLLDEKKEIIAKRLDVEQLDKLIESLLTEPNVKQEKKK